MDSVEVLTSGSKSGVGVLDKSVAILAFLSGGPATLPEVVEGTGLPRSTAHRLVSALETHHLVSRRDGRYVLGLRLLGCGTGRVTELLLAKLPEGSVLAIDG
ncbi:MAG: helix-turn-helix domain-containing protein, partial [Actinomycetota bacterium]|nr:helix-turn-helix domain-containing protein [Actinomycetota bacterium]